MSGVSEALNSHKDGDPKGIKAHFRMDESGLLKLDYVRSGLACIIIISAKPAAM